MKRGFSYKWFATKTAILFFGSCLIAVAVNAARPTPLDWVATSIYEIYQDCPESTVSAEETDISSVLQKRNNFLIVDTRSKPEILKLQIPESLAVQYDSLFPIEKEEINRILKESQGRSVLVIGNGSTAKLMADELVSNGLKNIFYLSKSSDYTKLGEPKEGLE